MLNINTKYCSSKSVRSMIDSNVQNYIKTGLDKKNIDIFVDVNQADFEQGFTSEVKEAIIKYYDERKYLIENSDPENLGSQIKDLDKDLIKPFNIYNTYMMLKKNSDQKMEQLKLQEQVIDTLIGFLPKWRQILKWY